MYRIFYILIFISFSLYAQDERVISQSSKDEVSSYTTLGNVISKKLIVTLKSELVKSIKEGGAIKSLKVCNIKAIPLTSELTETANNIVEIKRISKKYRNPMNKPDALELKALEYFESHSGELPETYVQKFSKNDSEYFNYYRILKVSGFCTTCHGDENKMDKELVAAIKQLYPEDRATGYNAGDFRGLIKVTFTE